MHFPKGHKLVFGSLYRPPDGNEIPIENLADILSVLSDTVFLGGDFNVPDITWTSYGAITNKSRINTSFKELLMWNNLTQYVLVPTRQQATLHIVLCNDPSVVTKVSTQPGLSDPEAVVTNLNISVVPTRVQIPRRVFLYEKGNFDAIQAELVTYLPIFQRLSESSDAEHLWSTFHSKLLELLEKYIPTKFLRQKKKDKPWFNSEVRKSIRKARSAYKKFCSNNTSLNRQNLTDANRMLKQKIKETKQSFFAQLNTDLKKKP